MPTAAVVNIYTVVNMQVFYELSTHAKLNMKPQDLALRDKSTLTFILGPIKT